jgi:acetyl/propionyl-CoA carboxylase alpha subunit
MLQRVLIANRGEIAIRLARGLAEAGLESVAVYAEDDSLSLHTRKADRAVPLRGVGPAAYLDIGQIVEVARSAGCQAVHPGYGFLSENAAFAAACEAAGLTSSVPPPGHPRPVRRQGPRPRPRRRGRRPRPLRHGRPDHAEDAEGFRTGLGPRRSVTLRRSPAGGGRGMRLVAPGEDLPAFERCASRALKAWKRRTSTSNASSP